MGSGASQPRSSSALVGRYSSVAPLDITSSSLDSVLNRRSRNFMQLFLQICGFANCIKIRKTIKVYEVQQIFETYINLLLLFVQIMAGVLQGYIELNDYKWKY